MSTLTEKRQAGVEVEPTQAMIDAGFHVLWGFDRNYDSTEETVRQIYRVMCEAAHEALRAELRIVGTEG